MSTELSTELVTHKLKIKWMDAKYITYKTAQEVFKQIVNPDQSTVTILNPENLTFISKYKSEVELIPLEWDEKTIEDVIFTSWISKYNKEKLRLKLAGRKKDNLPITEWIVLEIIEKKIR